MPDTPAEAECVVWTIGHSNHPLSVLLTLVERHEIAAVVDVRSRPYSQYAPQFNREAIGEALPARSVEYLFLGDLLGGRPGSGEFYDKEGHVRYDRLALSAGFLQGIDRLLGIAAARRTAILCSEEDPTSCHRRLLMGRVLAGRGIAVMHIRGDGRVQREEEIAVEEKARKSQGQLRFFDTEDVEEWKSPQPVLPRKTLPRSASRIDVELDD